MAAKSGSKWEDILALQIRGMRLPVPEKQVKFHPERKFRFDLAWREFLFYVEVDGGVWVRGRHTRATGYIKDTEKFNEAACLGWRGLRVVPDQIQSGAAIQWIKRMFALMKEGK